MIYEPREDSFLLEKEVRRLASRKRVLDMGAGSGIQAFAALESGASYVLCADINDEAVDFLKRKGLNAVKSDLFSNIKGKFDLIIFNPPYLPFDEREDKESSIITSGGKKGDYIIIRFLYEVRKYLGKEGIALMILSSLTLRKRILNVLKENNLDKDVLSREKIFMEELEVWRIRKI